MGATDMEEPIFTDSELDYQVRNALKAAVQGDCDSYNQLVGVIHHRERLSSEEVAALVTCLKAVTASVSCVHIVHHRSLLAAICGMSLWNYGTDVMDALVELLVSLASSRGEYVELCLETLVANFMPPSGPSSTYYSVDFWKQPRGIAKKTQVLERVHSTLKDISHLVPLLPKKLEEVLRVKMPNIYTKEPIMVMYVESMLRLENSPMGELVGSSVLYSLVDRLIELDVDIAWDEILQDDFQKGIFDMELEDLEGHAEDHIEEDSDKVSRDLIIQRFFSGNLVAQKLDSLMVLTFEHFNSCHERGRLDKVFATFLESFKKTIMTAYKSKFTQFVMFYACSLDPEICGTRFTDELLKIFMTNSNPEWRMSAVAYLASYLARARFVPVTVAAFTIESVVNWCFLYCQNHNGDINPRVHKVFYAACQAIMYVLCFRLRQMLAVPRLKSQLVLMRIEDIFGSPFKPLQVCLPSIVEEFLRLVKASNVISLPQSFLDHGLLESEHSRAFGGSERFDMFFPFDPCLLRKCDSYIRDNYVYWSTVRKAYEEDEDEVTSDEEDADTISGRGNRRMSDGSEMSDDEENFDDDAFDCSLDKMSITPRDSSAKFGGRMQRFVQMPSKIRPSTSPESL
ncbi:hypothetical protein ABFS82_01G044900 [Erythranthe guttata]|nr:PREDICTED: RNA polymerase I-specific transcription initiation factor RRN3-like [Erythranthe guttata]|eukprot:XP_012837320.1 PREDICTED: RNA polymerase I-specific transcription initiation factor RRN3-like [Erythranthe guttata]